MKIIKYIAMIAAMLTPSLTAWKSYTIYKQSEWPLVVPTLFLYGGVNAVVEGGDYLFWSQGD